MAAIQPKAISGMSPLFTRSDMYHGLTIVAIIPARDEALAISEVVRGLGDIENSEGYPVFDRIVVCDNGSSDDTAMLAERAGALVTQEPEAGYGRACLRAIEHAGDCDVLVFVDGDRSLYPEQALRLLDGITSGDDMTIGSRTRGNIEPQALTPPQRFGNALAVFLIAAIWGYRYSDLGPFRAIKMDAYRTLQMQDETYGWTVEMQVKALRLGMRVGECPVDSRARLGYSKISGTVRGVFGAGIGILGMIWRLWHRDRREQSTAASIAVESSS
jgi:glycosyltransferase involved in cell wall biosynthesis